MTFKIVRDDSPGLRLTDFTDEELSAALHFIEGHEDDLEGVEAVTWAMIKSLVLSVALDQKELN